MSRGYGDMSPRYSRLLKELKAQEESMERGYGNMPTLKELRARLNTIKLMPEEEKKAILERARIESAAMLREDEAQQKDARRREQKA